MFSKTPENIEFAGYTDDNTPYKYSSNIEIVLDNLQQALEKTFHWFPTNHLVANARKCHLLTSSKAPVDIHISIILLKVDLMLKVDLILIFI